MNPVPETLVEKLAALPPEQVAEVETFIDFLRHRADRTTTGDFAAASATAFARVWDNAEDAAYDEL